MIVSSYSYCYLPSSNLETDRRASRIRSEISTNLKYQGLCILYYQIFTDKIFTQFMEGAEEDGVMPPHRKYNTGIRKKRNSHSKK